MDVIKGFKKGTVTAFTEVFTSYCQDAVRASLDLGGARPFGYDNPMDEIDMLIRKAVDHYHNLCTRGQWNIPKGHKFAALGGSCWNCGSSDHMLSGCTEPSNEAKIKKSREEFFKNRDSNNGGRGRGGGGRGRGRGGSGRSGGAGRGSGSEQYTRKKWGTPKKGDPAVCWFQNVPHVYCGKSHSGKPCSWNSTHSTQYHNAAMTTDNWSVQKLAAMSPNHPLALATRQNPPGNNNTNQPTKPPPASQAPASSEDTALATVRHTKTVLSSLERTVKGDEARGVLEEALKALESGE